MTKLGLDRRNTVFGVCNQVRFNLACSATETSKNIKILHVGSVDVILPRNQITKVLIRLHGCAG